MTETERTANRRRIEPWALTLVAACLLLMAGPTGASMASDHTAVTPVKKGFAGERGSSRARSGPFVLRDKRRLYLRFRVPASWRGSDVFMVFDPTRTSVRGLELRQVSVRWRGGAPRRARLVAGSTGATTGRLARGVTSRVDVSSMLRPGRAGSVRIQARGSSRSALGRIPFLVAVPPDPAPDPDPDPDPEPTEGVEIAAVGDIACSPDNSQWNGGAGTPTDCRHEDVAGLVADRDEAVLLLGDVQYPDGTLAQFRAGFDPTWGHLADRLRPTPGNHEYYTSGAEGYFDYFDGLGVEVGERGAGYYGFELGEWSVVSLNSNCSSVACETGSPQETWLRTRLAEARTAERCTLAFWHHPAASSGYHGSQSRVGDLWSTFVELGGDVLLTGHDHHYERFSRLDEDLRPTGDGPLSWVIGTGGKSMRDVSSPIDGSARIIDDAFGLLRLELFEDSFAWEWSGLGGAGADSGTTSCRA